MLETPHQKSAVLPSTAMPAVSAGASTPTPEQIQRQRDLDELIRRGQAEWQALSPAERDAEDAAFAQVMRDIEDRRHRVKI